MQGTLLRRRPCASCFLFFTLCIGAGFLLSCSNSGVSPQLNGAGTIHVTISDPPSCAAPNGPFKHVFVSIRGVEAHTSASATDSSPGWQELVPALTSQPVQLDLFSLGAGGGCLLASLGSNTALPVGDYQQIRVLLVANAPAGPVPAQNACGNQGFNCVVLSDNSVHEINLSSQANTGLKIPPGQVLGGPIHVAAGQSVDLNIDFNACDSIVEQGNGQFRLKPALTAGQVSTNTTGISGQVVGASLAPIVGGTVLVALEQPDGSGLEHVIEQAATDASGNFNFCPLPVGTFDVVVVAIDGAGVAYNATMVFNVSNGAALGAIPLVPETGTTGPGTIQGFVTATTGTAVANVDASVSAMQTVSPSGIGTRHVIIPAEAGSTALLALQSNSTCPMGAPANSNCAQYTLVIPASNPNVGVFSAGKITFTAPAAGNVLFTVEAQTFVPLSGGTPTCSPGVETTSLDSGSNPLKVTAGATVTAMELDFTGCASGM